MENYMKKQQNRILRDFASHELEILKISQIRGFIYRGSRLVAFATFEKQRQIFRLL